MFAHPELSPPQTARPVPNANRGQQEAMERVVCVMMRRRQMTSRQHVSLAVRQKQAQLAPAPRAVVEASRLLIRLTVSIAARERPLAAVPAMSVRRGSTRTPIDRCVWHAQVGRLALVASVCSVQMGRSRTTT